MKYAVVAATVFAGDFFLKEHMEKQESLSKEIEICKGRIVIKKYHNKGAALNVMEQRPETVKRICGAVLLFLGVLWYVLFRKKANPGILLGLSLTIGGGASNFYDRVKKGYVVDYFSFRTPFKRLNQIIFNISDMCIFLGSLLIVVFGKDLQVVP